MPSRAIVLVFVAACGGNEPAASRPASTVAQTAAPADAGVAPDAFVFASLTGNGSIGSLEDFERGPRVKADVDKVIIRRHVRTRMKEIVACFEHERAAQPTLAGTVHVKFTIGATGDVSEAIASGVDPALDRCVEAEFKQMTFPAPKGGNGNVEVNYPLTFKPHG